MKIVLLARNPTLYSHKRLVEAAEKRGHQIQVINTLLVYMNITSNRPEIRYKGEVLRGFDAVIPRIGASITFYGLAVLNQFEMTGVYPLNNAESIARSRDKLRCMQLLARSGVGLPVTGFAHATQFTEDLIDMVGGTPIVIKLLEGTQGIGVVLAETPRSAKSVIEAFRGIHANILVQEYIREAGSSDIRCLVIGDRVVAAIQRNGAIGDFRSNLHRGGTATTVRITPEERATAVRSAKLMGLSVAGVDLLRSNHGPVVLEVNSSPGLEGLETATGIDVAGKIIEFLEKKVKSRPKNIPPAEPQSPPRPARKR
ncbi:MAG: 30S ribosomal protein S6--L-glutamate ligase [Magnetococcus sp. MYC-9]